MVCEQKFTRGREVRDVNEEIYVGYVQRLRNPEDISRKTQENILARISGATVKGVPKLGSRISGQFLESILQNALGIIPRKSVKKF